MIQKVRLKTFLPPLQTDVRGWLLDKLYTFRFFIDWLESKQLLGFLPHSTTALQFGNNWILPQDHSHSHIWSVTTSSLIAEFEKFWRVAFLKVHIMKNYGFLAVESQSSKYTTCTYKKFFQVPYASCTSVTISSSWKIESKYLLQRSYESYT